MSKTTILEVYQDKKGMYQCRLLARDGKLLFSSQKFEKKSVAMMTAKKLSTWVSSAILVDADKKADAASKTTGKQNSSLQGKKTVHKVVNSEAPNKTATKKVVKKEA